MAKAPTIEQLRMLALRVKLRRTSGVPEKSKKMYIVEDPYKSGKENVFLLNTGDKGKMEGETTEREDMSEKKEKERNLSKIKKLFRH